MGVGGVAFSSCVIFNHGYFVLINPFQNIKSHQVIFAARSACRKLLLAFTVHHHHSSLNSLLMSLKLVNLVATLPTLHILYSEQ